MTTQTDQRQYALDYLRAQLTPTATLYTVQRHRSPSGRRSIDFYIFQNNEPIKLTSHILHIITARFDAVHGGLITTDRETALYHLACRLWPEQKPRLKTWEL